VVDSPVNLPRRPYRSFGSAANDAMSHDIRDQLFAYLEVWLVFFLERKSIIYHGIIVRGTPGSCY